MTEQDYAARVRALREAVEGNFAKRARLWQATNTAEQSIDMLQWAWNEEEDALAAPAPSEPSLGVVAPSADEVRSPVPRAHDGAQGGETVASRTAAPDGVPAHGLGESLSVPVAHGSHTQQWDGRYIGPAPSEPGPYRAERIEEARDDWWRVLDASGEVAALTDGECATRIVAALNAAPAPSEPGLGERLADAYHAAGLARSCRSRNLVGNDTAKLIHRATVDEPAGRAIAAEYARLLGGQGTK